jgi:hypothetical protein
MKMDVVAGSQNDEFYTPSYAITPLLKYLRLPCKVWCPFDTDESLFVKILKDFGCDVINTHLQAGQDFFTTEIDCDVIISNPPYSKKAEVFDRLFSLGKPFAMLVGLVGLFESQKRFTMFSKHDFEIMYFDKRISYFKSYADKKPSLNPPFSSVYLTRNVLPKQIVFETIIKVTHD